LDADWTLVEEGLGFRSQDGLGYDHDLNALMTWNHACVECGDNGFGPNRILMDNLFVGDCDDCVLPPLPGDLDGDGDVDFGDFSVLAGNLTGTVTPPEPPGTGGKLPEEGDIDGDGDVDFTDFSTFAFNFTGTINAPASDAPPTEGNVHLEIDLTRDGAMTLQLDNANLAGYSVRSPDSRIVPDADGAAAPFLFYLLNAPQEVTAGTVGAAAMLTGNVMLDITFAGSVEEAQNVVFEYTRFGEVTPVAGIVHVVPEPATMILLAAGGLLMTPRRRSA